MPGLIWIIEDIINFLGKEVKDMNEKEIKVECLSIVAGFAVSENGKGTNILEAAQDLYNWVSQSYAQDETETDEKG